MNEILKFLADHHEALLVGASFVGISVAQTMPADWGKGFGATLWKWIYDATQEAMSARSGRLVSGPPPRAAVEVPQPIEAKPQP